MPFPSPIVKNILRNSHKAGTGQHSPLLRLLSSAIKLVKTKLYLSGLVFPVSFCCLKTVGEILVILS